MKPPQILVLGNNSIDHVFISPGLCPGEKVNAISLKHYAGGQAANVAYCLAVLGLSVHYVGAFGDDIAGADSKTSLSDCGISLEGQITVPDCPNQTAVVINDFHANARTIVMYKDERLRLRAEDVKPEWVTSSNLVYIDNHEPEAALAAAQAANERHIPVLADLECLGPLVLEILRETSSLIAPHRVLCEMSGTTDIEVALKRAQQNGPSTVVATLESAGAIGIGSDNVIVSVPASSCEVVDTTGAGDAFHAGYIVAICAGMNFEGALKFAAHVAAAKCEEHGPRIGRSRALRSRELFLENAEWQIPLRGHFI